MRAFPLVIFECRLRDDDLLRAKGNKDGRKNERKSVFGFHKHKKGQAGRGMEGGPSDGLSCDGADELSGGRLRELWSEATGESHGRDRSSTSAERAGEFVEGAPALFLYRSGGTALLFGNGRKGLSFEVVLENHLALGRREPIESFVEMREGEEPSGVFLFGGGRNIVRMVELFSPLGGLFRAHDFAGFEERSSVEPGQEQVLFFRKGGGFFGDGTEDVLGRLFSELALARATQGHMEDEPEVPFDKDSKCLFVTFDKAFEEDLICNTIS